MTCIVFKDGKQLPPGTMLTYNPPPHMDAVAMIRRAAARLRAWHAKYGEHNPQWLPPAGDVRWLEDADAFLAAHTLPAAGVEGGQAPSTPAELDAALAEVHHALRGTRRHFGEVGSKDIDIVAHNAAIDRAMQAINAVRAAGVKACDGGKD